MPIFLASDLQVSQKENYLTIRNDVAIEESHSPYLMYLEISDINDPEVKGMYEGVSFFPHRFARKRMSKLSLSRAMQKHLMNSICIEESLKTLESFYGLIAF